MTDHVRVLRETAAKFRTDTSTVYELFRRAEAECTCPSVAEKMAAAAHEIVQLQRALAAERSCADDSVHDNLFGGR